MAKYDYIFVDESGDPGYAVHPQTGALLSSPSFAMAALHVTDDSYQGILRHMAAFRYLRRLSRELKIPVGKPEFDRLMDPIQTLAEGGEAISASAVYLDKETFSGPYLRPDSPRGQDARRFWSLSPTLLSAVYLSGTLPQSPHLASRYDLVLDRSKCLRAQKAELEEYLDRNLTIPTPVNVTLASSLYVEALQVVHHIANAYGTAQPGKGTHDSLRFARAIDITTG